MIAPPLAEIETLQATIAQNQKHVTTRETATRYALIDRVLSLLGWDVHDAGRVILEYAAGAASNARVDYALRDGDKTQAFVEAKALGTPLRLKELEQLSNYCVNKSVRWGVLTNGDHWQVLDAKLFDQRLPERVVLDFRLSALNAEGALRQVITLHATVYERSAAQLPSIVVPVVEPTLPPTGDGWQGLETLVLRATPRARCAVELRFPDGSEVTAQAWAHVLHATVKWAVDAGKLAASICPLADHSGKSRFLVATEPMHANRVKFKGPKLYAGLYYHTNYNCRDCCLNAVHLLKAVGVDPATVLWRPKP